MNGTIKQPHDPGVFRGPFIDFEGYFDICADVIREAANELGMVDTDKVVSLMETLTLSEIRAEALEAENQELRTALAALIRLEQQTAAPSAVPGPEEPEPEPEVRKVPAKKAPRIRPVSMAGPEL